MLSALLKDNVKQKLEYLLRTKPPRKLPHACCIGMAICAPSAMGRITRSCILRLMKCCVALGLHSTDNLRFLTTGTPARGGPHDKTISSALVGVVSHRGDRVEAHAHAPSGLNVDGVSV